MQEYEDRIKINHTPFVIQWTIDVDTAVVEAVTVDTAEGSCVFSCLELAVKEKIKRFLNKRMDEMSKEAKDSREIARYEDQQAYKDAWG